MNLSDLWAQKGGPGAAAAPAEADSSTASSIRSRRLGELRDQGLLSAEQFRVQKGAVARPAHVNTGAESLDGVMTKQVVTALTVRCEPPCTHPT